LYEVFCPYTSFDLEAAENQWMINTAFVGLTLMDWSEQRQGQSLKTVISALRMPLLQGGTRVRPICLLSPGRALEE
jgi:hypothetical protein